MSPLAGCQLATSKVTGLVLLKRAGTVIRHGRLEPGPAMLTLKSTLTALLIAAASSFTVSSAFASTKYPLTIENCGAQVSFQKAPERAIGLGQNSAEILLLLGLQDKMAGTAFWPSKVLPQLADANAKVKLLSVEFPTFESIL